MEICKIYSLKWFGALLFILALFYACPANGMVMAPREVDRFDIVISDVVIAGEPFTVRIIAKDKFDNTIVNYDEIGGKVEIKIIGRGKIAPDMISASKFKDGVATIDFIYDRAGTFTIITRTKLGFRFKPKVIAKKVIKAVKREKVKELDLATERLDQAVKVKFGLEERLIRLTKALEEKEKENLSLKATLSEVILDRANLKDQLAETRAILAQSEDRLTELEAGEPFRKVEAPVAMEIPAGRPKLEYFIGCEDELEIFVWQNPDLTKDVTVRPDGRISFPLVGDVQAVGLTLTELDRELTERLKVYVKSPEVSVTLRKFGGKKVIVLGEVKSPGVYRATGKYTILEVIALAGGFTEDAVLSSVILVRGDLRQPEARRVNLTKVMKQGDLAENITVRPEDVVYIPKKFIANINYFLRQFTPALSAADLAKKWGYW